jgi:hypothetical protein
MTSAVRFDDTHDGRRVLLAGQKSGMLHALNHTGEFLWQTRAGRRRVGGIEWGFATDGLTAHVIERVRKRSGRLVLSISPMASWSARRHPGTRAAAGPACAGSRQP